MLTLLIACLTLGGCTAARWYLHRTSRRDSDHAGGLVRLRSLWNRGAAFGMGIRFDMVVAASLAALGALWTRRKQAPAGVGLLLGGGGHRTGKPGGGWEELEAFARRYFPNSRETCRWAAQDCMTLDGVPYIGQYGRHTPGLYVATGFNKWGMTSSMTAAMVLSDLVQGKRNPYAAVFSPARTVLRPQLLANLAEATASLLTVSKPRCPHMGCALKWNPLERTWDCPCHGSRFTEDGELLDNPATGGLQGD